MSDMKRAEFVARLQNAVNCLSMENASDTPDFILAEYLCGCLENFDRAVIAREKWYGRDVGSGKAILGSAPETSAEQTSYIKTRDCEHDWKEIDAYPFRAARCTKCGASKTLANRETKA
jgi:hypothetical protein